MASKKLFIKHLAVAGGNELLDVIKAQSAQAQSWELGALVNATLQGEGLAAVLVDEHTVYTANGKKGTPYSAKFILSLDSYYAQLEIQNAEQEHWEAEVAETPDAGEIHDAAAEVSPVAEYLTEKFAKAQQIADAATTAPVTEEAPQVIEALPMPIVPVAPQDAPQALVEAPVQPPAVAKLDAIQALISTNLTRRNTVVVALFQEAWIKITSEQAALAQEQASIEPLTEQIRTCRAEALRLEASIPTMHYQGKGTQTDWASILVTLDRCIADKYMQPKAPLMAAATTARIALEEAALYEAQTRAQIKALNAQANGLLMQVKELRAATESHKAHMLTMFAQDEQCRWALSAEVQARTSYGKNPQGLVMHH